VRHGVGFSFEQSGDGRRQGLELRQDQGAPLDRVDLPEDRYTVCALIWDDRKGQREATLERGLVISQDLERRWRVPMTSIDFGGNLDDPRTRQSLLYGDQRKSGQSLPTLHHLRTYHCVGVSDVGFFRFHQSGPYQSSNFSLPDIQQ
jgi:hypothetical protein